jgi:leucyl aminopeptidase
MKLSVRQGRLDEVKADALILGVFQGRKDAAARLSAPFAGQVRQRMAGARFDGAWGKLHPTDLGDRRVVLVGLGPRDEIDGDRIRRAAAKAARALDHRSINSIATAALGVDPSIKKQVVDPETAARLTGEGALLSAYRWDRYKSAEKPRRQTRLLLVAADAAQARAWRRAAKEADAVAAGVQLTRDLANLPGADGDAAKLAAEARRMARAEGLSCKVLSETEIRREKMGGLLAVAAGSAKPPKFIILEHKPAGRARQQPVVLIGKGITFDSGGISLKPGAEMDLMRFDKAGGCAVIGAMLTVARLKLPVHAVGLVPACENMPGGSATRPGDILTMHSGKTVEVLNTDAEGRLILADALSYAARYKPALMVDAATLTGAAMVALGKHAAGAFCSSDDVARRIDDASRASGEKTWRLPLWDAYRKEIQGNHADLKNTGGRYGGACTAAAFLAEFAGDAPWCHLDIAPVGWGEAHDLGPKGATGFGTRLLVELLRDWDSKGKGRK